MQKKLWSGTEVIRFCAVCLGVCPSVRLSLRKSAVTFEPLDGTAQNFQGPLNSSQVIFGRVTQTPRPRKSGFLPDLSPPGVFGQGGRVTPFWN